MKYHYYGAMAKTFRENPRDELDYQDMKVNAGVVTYFKRLADKT